MFDQDLDDIAVVIINYNSNRFLEGMYAYLDGIVEHIEINVVDDRSNDGSLEKLQSRYAGKIVFTVNEKNSGAAFTRNFALKNIDKKYLLFLDPDIKASANSILSLARKRKEADIVFPRIDFSGGGTMSPVNDFEKERCTNSAIYVIDRERVAASQQYFDEDMFVYNEDSDLFSRWWAFGLVAKYIPEVIVEHPLKASYSERLFFYRVRNPFILFIKQAGLIRFRMNPWLWIIAYTGLNFLAAIFNRNFSVAKGGFEKVRVSDRPGMLIPRIRLIFIFFRAMIWNLINISQSLKKRNILKSQLNNR